MTVELQLTLVSYDADSERAAVLRRELPEGANVARTGDRVAANENWPPLPVEAVTWDEDLVSAVVVLASVDADDVGPLDVALDLLHQAGWRVIDVDDAVPEVDEAATAPGFE